MTKQSEYIEYENGKKILLDADDVPELNDEFFNNAKRFNELPLELQQGLLSLKKIGRPKIDSPKKIKSFKLSQDVIEGITKSGKGYNARVDKVLREALNNGMI